jgi:hypothetical protein
MKFLCKTAPQGGEHSLQRVIKRKWFRVITEAKESLLRVITRVRALRRNHNMIEPHFRLSYAQQVKFVFARTRDSRRRRRKKVSLEDFCGIA